MSQSVPHPDTRLRRALRHFALLAALCLVVAGCKSWHLRGDEFQDNSLSDFCGQIRHSDGDDSVETWAFSNKAQQIERNLGAR